MSFARGCLRTSHISNRESVAEFCESESAIGYESSTYKALRDFELNENMH